MYTCEDRSGEIFYLRTSFCFPTDSKFTLSWWIEGLIFKKEYVRIKPNSVTGAEDFGGVL